MAALEKAPAIGIDLGTTYSAVAVLLHGKVELIANEFGQFTTPSCVAYTNTEQLVGHTAKKLLVMNPTNTVYDVKRLIGRKFHDPMVQNDMKHWPFKVINCNDMPKVQVEYKGEFKQFFPEEISAAILMKMKSIAEAYLNQTVTNAVITVPAYFNNCQRQATVDAAKIAGLNVLRILNEPTAAALAYGFQNKHVQTGNIKNILVYDLGGGTFDVSILRKVNNHYKVLATAGDTHLGGEDFNSRLSDCFLQEMKTSHKRKVPTNPTTLQRLNVAVEEAKRDLSSAVQTTIFCDGFPIPTTISRARFEFINVDLFDRTLQPVRSALADSGLLKEQINEVILVGGSTRIPKVQKMLYDFFDGKKELNKRINADEAVAYGAAVLAAVLNGDFSMKIFDTILEDVIPLSLGIGSDANFLCMSTLLKRNTTIPAKATRMYKTLLDYQTAVNFPIYQGESLCAPDNHLLGNFTLYGLPPAPAGVKKANVTFDINADGILTVTAVDTDNSTNFSSITITNVSTQLKTQEIQRMIDEGEKQRQEVQLNENAVAVKVEQEEKWYQDIINLLDNEDVAQDANFLNPVNTFIKIEPNDLL